VIASSAGQLRSAGSAAAGSFSETSMSPAGTAFAAASSSAGVAVNAALSSGNAESSDECDAPHPARIRRTPARFADRVFAGERVDALSTIGVMNKIPVGLLVFAAACSGDPHDAGGGSGMKVSGTISTDTTWGPGPIDVTGPVTIDAGVTLTLAAGTLASMESAAGFTVNGTLDAPGTKAAPIEILPTSDGGGYASTNVESGGMVVFSYVTQRGGGFDVVGTVMVTDSAFSNAQGDFMVVDGGALDMQFSELGIGAPNGAGVGDGDTTHCNFHINNASSITVNSTNVAGSPYGVMLYSFQSANFKTDNFYGNGYDFEPAESGAGSIDGSWFSSGSLPPQAGVSGAVASVPVAAGPR
jgi:hypothetical protein